MTQYGALYAEERKAELLATLIDVVRQEIPQDTPQEIKAKIPEFAADIVNAGPAGFMIHYLLNGKHIDAFCEGCHGAPCCNESNPIAITWKDIKRIAAHYDISSKEAIKQYFTHKVNPDNTEVTHCITHTEPCGWNDPSTFRCTIYNSRPDICSTYPVKFDPEKGISVVVTAFCNVAFNIMRYAVRAMVLEQTFSVTNPKLWAHALEEMEQLLPPKDNNLTELKRWEQLALAFEKMNKILGIDIWPKED
jgi:Predicted Fe-S-cluster oxidoreductase